MTRRILITIPVDDQVKDELNKQFPDFEVSTVIEDDYPEELLLDTEVYVSFRCHKDILNKAPHVRWIQSLRSGLDGLPLDEIHKKNILLTSAQGIHKEVMTEYVMGAMILASRNWHQMFYNQVQRKWDRMPYQGHIHEAVVGILGLGNVGRSIAKMAKQFGMKVIGTKKNYEEMEFVDEIFLPVDIGEIFKRSDYVINLIPLTDDTKGMINGDLFRLMPSNACFISIGRGATINEADLTKALQNETMRMAILDVFEEEPLPKEHPFWDLKNVIITPHVSGSSSEYFRMAYDLFYFNLEEYVHGRFDKMRNLIQFEK